MCAPDLSGRGGISEYSSGRGGISEVFLILGYCRVVLFDSLFFSGSVLHFLQQKGWIFWRQRGLWVRAVLWKLLQG